MKPDTEGKSLPSTLSLIVSVLVHLLLLAPYLYLIIIYFIHYSLYSWHPICMSIGAGILMLEAVYSVSGEAYLGHRFSRANRINIHWIINTAGLILMFIGFIVIIVYKNMYNVEHFTTSHGQLGLSTIIIASGVAGFGIVTNNTRWVYPRIRPVVVKVVHALGGIIVAVLLTATNINGVYISRFGDTVIGLICASLVIATVLVLIKPIIAATARLKVILQPPQPHNQSA